MFTHQVSTAFLAPFAMALLGLVIGIDMFCACHYLDLRGLPQGESVDGTRRPVAAICTVAVTHASGFARSRDLHASAEAASLMHSAHGGPFWIK
jgi:hypothetical protein